MFTRPPSEVASPPPYSPGYLAFPPANCSNAATDIEETCVFRDQVRLHRERLKAEQEELERTREAQTAADVAWQQGEEARRARRAKLKEEALKAEIEWERMGGTVRDTEPTDAELRRKLDTEASLTHEERTLKRAWEDYDKAWDCLATSIRPVKTFTFRKLSFTFSDIPWPVLPVPRERDAECDFAVSLEDITGPSVASFLLHPLRDPQKSKREKLREAILRYHPDKFVGRILPRVVVKDKARVQEAVGVVMKCLNELMNVET